MIVHTADLVLMITGPIAHGATTDTLFERTVSGRTAQRSVRPKHSRIPMKTGISGKIRPMRNMIDILQCVVCGRWLCYPRQHVDTCGERCFKRLLRQQRMEHYS